MLKRTELYQQHQQAGAKLVDFFGWEMPLHYGSQLQEHHAVRQVAGVFDVSHMTVVDLLGAGGRNFLRSLLANDVDSLANPGTALYSCMLNPQGGILDDLIVYWRAPDNYRIVLNSATRSKDLAWLQAHANGANVGIQERPELAMLAVQGPQAIAKTLSVLPAALMDAASTLDNFECVEIQDWFIARTGYTGEDGFEIILPQAQAAALWQSLLEVGVAPCGLGARDTLRLEAGMLLYGQDMDATTTPLESGLGWTVAWQPEQRQFIGRAALNAQRQQGIKTKLVGLLLSGEGIMRSQQRVVVEGVGEGIITSGGFAPTLERSIALARVPSATGQECLVTVRGKLLAAQVVKPRFVWAGKSLLD